ncbi:MAG: Trp family transcriptional regulator [Candidatus Daviesbacteria bacterium]|nr:Trp family transcriptional regulator [Candidatus Daviesbacteria bacterium]
MSKPSIDRSINVPDDLIKKLLTDSEWRMIKQRLHIINLLDDGLSIRQIADQAGVGTDTVVRVSKMATSRSLRKKTNLKKLKNPTPWIFGKTE